MDGQPSAGHVWLQRATEGNARGTLRVAEQLRTYKDNSDLAEEWYRQAFHLGEWEAAVRLGLLRHRNGDDAEANRWFERAVGGGGRFVAGHIAFLLSHEPEDAALSTAWYNRAAEMGDVRSMGRYAHRLANGIGVSRNPAEAFRWRLRAAGNAQADGYDLLALARAYDEGSGTPRDPEAALRALRTAKGKWIDDSDTKTSVEMNEMEERLTAEVAQTAA